MQPKHWTAFIVLGAIWSASFLWIKIALDEIGPFSLVAFRVLFGVLFAGGAVFLQRKAWPRDWTGWFPFLLLVATSSGSAIPGSLTSARGGDETDSARLCSPIISVGSWAGSDSAGSCMRWGAIPQPVDCPAQRAHPAFQGLAS
jgi:hypothetical protein